MEVLQTSPLTTWVRRRMPREDASRQSIAARYARLKSARAALEAASWCATIRRFRALGPNRRWSFVYKIAVIGGDGTGPEVTHESVKVLKAAADTFGFKLELVDYDLGGERYLRTGEVLPESAVTELSRFDAILLGAIGHPDVKPGVLEKGILLRL